MNGSVLLDDVLADKLIRSRGRWSIGAGEAQSRCRAYWSDGLQSLSKIGKALKQGLSRVSTKKSETSATEKEAQNSGAHYRGSRLIESERQIAADDDAVVNEVLHSEAEARVFLNERLSELLRFRNSKASAESSFTVAVFGRTGVGKSTLISALTGSEGTSISTGKSGFTSRLVIVLSFLLRAATIDAR